MDADYWLSRWRDGRTGFHEGSPNAQLVRHALVLGPAGTVFVPLAGKSVDMVHLAALGHRVVGVELSREAVAQFFADRASFDGLGPPDITQEGPFEVFRAGAFTLYVGDFFALTSEHLRTVTAFYDRAALVALPPEMRAKYMERMCALLPGRCGLLITIEFEDARMSGPPFHVARAELESAYPCVEVLDGEDWRLREGETVRYRTPCYRTELTR
jgi:thiopurine S-methyltransferase